MNDTTQLPEMTSYLNTNLHVSIQVPVGWTGKVVHTYQFRIFSLPEPDFDDYRSTMSYELGRSQGEGQEWLEELIGQSKQDLESDLSVFRQIRERRFMLTDEVPAYVRWYEWRDEDTGLHFSQVQSFMLTSAGMMYLINAATLKPIEDKYMPIFDAILESTTIIPY